MPRPGTSVPTQLSRQPGPSIADPCCFASKTLTLGAVQARGTQKSFLLDDDFRLDLLWWDTFLTLWNGTTSFLDVDWSTPDILHLYTDASGTLGLGAFFQKESFQSRWHEWILHDKPAIEYLEMVPVLLAVIVWKGKIV